MNQPARSMPMGTQNIGGQAIHWGGVPPRASSKILKGTLTALTVVVALGGIALSIAPGVTNFAAAAVSGVSHVVDRLKNGVDASDELEHRAKYYSNQIFKTLGMNPREGQVASVKDFKLAASINPELSKIYQAPITKKEKENRSSLLTNGAIGAATAVIPLGGSGVAGVGEIAKVAAEGHKVLHVAKSMLPGIKHMVGVTAAGLAGGAVADALSKDQVDPQELVEALHNSVAEAKAKGMNLREVVSPNLVFMLRVSQDENFADKLKKDFGKPFHKMSAEEQTQVMGAYPALANAATSEAYAVANSIVPVQELGASKPNLNGTANQYAVGGRNSSFASMVQSRRAAAMPQGFGQGA